jgi:hypothetical protein
VDLVEEYGLAAMTRHHFFGRASAGSGATAGETDDYRYNIVADPVPVFDLQATVLRCVGIDHKRLTDKFQGRHFRLTDVHGEVAGKLLA